MVRDAEGDEMIALSSDGIWRFMPKIGVVVLWLMGVLFFVTAYSRISGFMGGILEGRAVPVALDGSLLRPFPGVVVMLAVLAVALIFVALQVVIFGGASWRLIVLSVALQPLSLLVIGLFSLLAWADRQGILIFGFEYAPWLVSIFAISIFVSLGFLFGFVADRFLGSGLTFWSRALNSAFLFVDCGILVVVAQFAVNMWCR